MTILSAADIPEPGIAVNMGTVIYVVGIVVLTILFLRTGRRTTKAIEQEGHIRTLLERTVELLESIDRKLDRDD